jgi:hypothetical protein
MMYSAQIHSTWLFFKEKPHGPPLAPLYLYEKCSKHAAVHVEQCIRKIRWSCLSGDGLEVDALGLSLVMLGLELPEQPRVMNVISSGIIKRSAGPRSTWAQANREK